MTFLEKYIHFLKISFTYAVAAKFSLAFYPDVLYYNNMYKILRILFCILTVALAAAAVFVFIYAGWIWGCLVIVCAFVFGALMVTFKQLQEKEEKKKNPPPPQGDFIFGKPSDENKEQ